MLRWTLPSEPTVIFAARSYARPSYGKAAVVVAALALTGCGGGSPAETSTSARTTAVTAAPPASSSPPPTTTFEAPETGVDELDAMLIAEKLTVVVPAVYQLSARVADGDPG